MRSLIRCLAGVLLVFPSSALGQAQSTQSPISVTITLIGEEERSQKEVTVFGSDVAGYHIRLPARLATLGSLASAMNFVHGLIVERGEPIAPAEQVSLRREPPLDADRVPGMAKLLSTLRSAESRRSVEGGEPPSVIIYVARPAGG